MMPILFGGATPLVIFILKATLVLASALAATFALRRGTAGERHLVWLAALVGVLALPVLSRIPSLQMGVLPSRFFTQSAPVAAEATTPPEMAAMLAPAAPMTTTITREPDGHLVVVAGTPAPTPLPAVPIDAATPPPSLFQTLAIVWAAVAASLLGWLVFGAFQVRRIVRNGVELSSSDWTTPLCEVADRIDLEQPPRLVMSDRIEMAFACRALAPTIVLPAAAESWTDERRRAVLFHELAHVKRHDLIAHTLGRLACALYWFHPLVWTAAKQLRAESEKACDDLVLSCGAKPSEYAQHLLDMVTSVRNYGAPVMALPMARKREFEGRMLAILDPAVRRAAPGRLQAATVVATVGALSLGVAAAAPAAPVSHVAAPAAATEQAGMPTLVVVDTPPASTIDARERVADSVRDARAEARAMARTQYRDSEDAMVTGHLSEADKRVLRSVDGMTRNIVTQTLRTMGISGTMRTQGLDTARANLLIKVLSTDADAGVRRSAAWALNDLHTTAADDALIRALASDADASVREMAAWALAESTRDAAGTTLANALLHDKSTKVRATSAWALGEQDRNHQPDALVSAVSDAEPDVRYTAIWAIGQSDLRRAPMPVINALSDNSARVREVAAWALGEIEDSSATRALTRALETEAEARPKTALLWALSNIGTVPTSAIESAMKSSDPELRRRAVAMLAGAGNAWPWPWPWPQPRPNP